MHLVQNFSFDIGFCLLVGFLKNETKTSWKLLLFSLIFLFLFCHQPKGKADGLLL